MSVKRLDTYTIICDWPDCGADVMDGTDYSGFGEIDHVLETVSDYEWWLGMDGQSHFCNDHPSMWASDLGGPPSPPYLLIHDGDTGDHDHDGKVTLVRPVTEVLLDEGNVPLPEVFR